MTGTIKKINKDRGFAFISTDKADYFMHRDDFDGHWEDLIKDTELGIIVEVEFEPTRTTKGLRANEVRRTDNG